MVQEFPMTYETVSKDFLIKLKKVRDFYARFWKVHYNLYLLKPNQSIENAL